MHARTRGDLNGRCAQDMDFGLHDLMLAVRSSGVFSLHPWPRTGGVVQSKTAAGFPAAVFVSDIGRFSLGPPLVLGESGFGRISGSGRCVPC